MKKGVLIITLIGLSIGIKAQNTFPENGNVGIGTTNPKAILDVGKFIPDGTLGTVFGRLPEGNTSADGTYLGVKGHKTQGFDINNIKSFSLVHNFYGQTNSSINFYRGGSVTGGFLTFNTSNDIERMRILGNGNVGIGTTNPKAILDVGKFIPDGTLGTVFGRLPEGNTSADGTYLGVKGHKTQGSDIDNIKSFSLVHNFYGQTNSSINFYRGGSVTGGFLTFNTSNDIERMRILGNGNIGIGTSETGNHRLAVEGSIGAREIKVEATGWSDFVFYDNYKLPTLKEVENHIKEKGHLKDIPSAKEVIKNGFFLGEMNSKLLQKIEELTLYTIQQEKRLNSLEFKNEKLEKENEVLKTVNSKFIELQSRLEKLESKK